MILVFFWNPPWKIRNPTYSKYLITFALKGRIVRLSSVRSHWGFALVPLVAFLTCVANRGELLQLYLESSTTLMCFTKCNLTIVTNYMTTKCSATVKFKCGCSKGFTNWPFTTSIWKFGWSFRQLHQQRHLSQLGRLLIGRSWSRESYRANLFFVWELQRRTVTCRFHLSLLFS